MVIGHGTPRAPYLPIGDSPRRRAIGQSGRVTSPTTGSLSDDDRAVIKGCLNAAVHGPFFPEWEFHALFGLTRSEVEVVLTSWPNLPMESPSGYASPERFQVVAVNNALNHLLGYPHGVRGEAFVREVGASAPQVAAVLTRWRSDDTFDDSGKGYFDRLM